HNRAHSALRPFPTRRSSDLEDVVEHSRLQRSGKEPNLLRSHTGEALEPVLAEGPYVERPEFDPAQLDQRQDGDQDISEVGSEVAMPWEVDGRRWHTVDRVGRRGEPCKWDGRILAKVADRIQELGDFDETNWSQRSVVEITGRRKSDGWFFHAIT